MKKAIYVMNDDTFDLVYPTFIRNEIGELVDVMEAPMTRQQLMENMAVLADVEIILTGWS